MERPQEPQPMYQPPQQQQQQLPPQQYQQQYQPYQTVKQQPVYTSPKGMWASKLALRILSSIFCAVVIGLSVTSAANWGVGPIVFFVPPASFSLCWNLAESICLCVRGGHRGIHPGACVGLDLIIWLGWTATSVLYGLLGYASDPYAYYSYYWDDDEVSGLGRNQANLAFAILALLIHFTLFVIACYETNVRNHQGQIVYVPAFAPMAVQPGMQHQSMIIPQPQMMYPQQMQYAKPHESVVMQETAPPSEPSPIHSRGRPVYA